MELGCHTLRRPADDGVNKLSIGTCKDAVERVGPSVDGLQTRDKSSACNDIWIETLNWNPSTYTKS